MNFIKIQRTDWPEWLDKPGDEQLNDQQSIVKGCSFVWQKLLEAKREMDENPGKAQFAENFERWSTQFDRMQPTFLALPEAERNEIMAQANQIDSQRFQEICHTVLDGMMSDVRRKAVANQERLAADLAPKLGKIVPLGENWESTSASSLEQELVQEEAALLKALTINGIARGDVDRYLDDNMNRPARFCTILKYAASQGWLSDLDTESGMALGRKIVVPSTWNQDQITTFYRELQKLSGSDV